MRARLPGPTYQFGVYHWRRRLRAVLLGIGASLAGAALWRLRRNWLGRAIAGGFACAGVLRTGQVVASLLTPPPWDLDRYKYDALARLLPLDGTTRVLDVGCGTGRSLVGLAPSLPATATVVGLDVFDDRVILGNGPRLARRNATAAGCPASPVRGDAVRLPFESASFDVVTACRVLHDLPEAQHVPALRELGRVCADDGHIGVLELPIAPASADDAAAYWHGRIEAAGLTLTATERVPRRRGGDPYILAVATT